MNETKTMKFLLFFFLLLFVMAGAISSDIMNDKEITSLPHNSSENVTINIDGNNTYPIVIVCNSTETACQYVTPSLSNFTNSSNITFTTFIPSGTENKNVTETFTFYINGTDLIENLSVVYDLNINIPPTPEANITITGVEPSNNTFFGQYDNLPNRWRITYTGDLDIDNSEFILYHNNSIFTDHNFWNDTNALIWNLTSAEDGAYELHARFQDAEGYNKTELYKFQIKTSQPPKPLSISPTHGRYTDEVKDLDVVMDNNNYSVYYLVNDGYPSIANSNWKELSYLGDRFSKLNLDFSSQGVGQVYLKIIDEFGNIRIEPTCIVSAPSITINIEDRTKSVEPGDEIILDVEVDVKKGSGDFLRCRMKDFIANEDENDEVKWSTKNTATLQILEENDNDMFLEEDYDMTIDLDSKTNEELELIISIPINAKINEDYRTELECIIS